MIYLEIDAEIDRRLEDLGATDEGSKAELARRELLRALDQRATEDVALRALVEEAAADGPGVEWTEEDWERLARGDYREAPEENSLAVPPGWRSPRLAK